MENSILLGEIPSEEYINYRYDAIFNAYKWDPQVQDHNTVSHQAILLSRKAANELANLVEKLAAETMEIEKALINNLGLVKELGLPKDVEKTLKLAVGSYNPQNHVRLMRFDFHPTTSGWAISEVNSDVPGGLAEASLLPKIAAKFFPGYEPGQSVGDHILNSFKEKIPQKSTMAFVHATSFSDDRQVMQYLADHFEQNGYKSIFAAPNHFVWENGKPFCTLDNKKTPVDGICRFYPLEWLTYFGKKTPWKDFYTTAAPCCNHPAAILSQSKRLPLVWDKLGVDISTWKALLPETIAPRSAPRKDESWIFKPALGRVGGGISIKEAVSAKEYKYINLDARLFPKEWVAQKRFESKPVLSQSGEPFHICIGAFTVDGKSAGFYARTSRLPRIDERAEDIPVLVAKE